MTFYWYNIRLNEYQEAEGMVLVLKGYHRLEGTGPMNE
jgi:hypothetical protein